MLSKFLKSTLFFLLAFGLCAYSTTVDLHHVSYAKHDNAPANATSVSSGGSSSTFGSQMGQNGAAHLTSQNYRPVQIVKEAIVLKQIVFISVNCSKYISRGSELSFSRLRKLVLFPFHAFW